jgi:hypothetical protein
MNLLVIFRDLRCFKTTDDFFEGSDDEVTLRIIGQNGPLGRITEIVGLGETNVGTIAKGQTRHFGVTVFNGDAERFDFIRFFFFDEDTLSDRDTLGTFTVSGKGGNIVWAAEQSSEDRGASSDPEFAGFREFFLNGREGEYSVFFTAELI